HLADLQPVQIETLNQSVPDDLARIYLQDVDRLTINAMDDAGKLRFGKDELGEKVIADLLSNKICKLSGKEAIRLLKKITRPTAAPKPENTDMENTDMENTDMENTDMEN